MGNLVNPISMRIGVNINWNSQWVSYQNNKYSFILSSDYLIYSYLEWFCKRNYFDKLGWTIFLSHYKVVRIKKKIIIIFFFKDYKFYKFVREYWELLEKSIFKVKNNNFNLKKNNIDLYLLKKKNLNLLYVYMLYQFFFFNKYNNNNNNNKKKIIKDNLCLNLLSFNNFLFKFYFFIIFYLLYFYNIFSCLKFKNTINNILIYNKFSFYYYYSKFLRFYDFYNLNNFYLNNLFNNLNIFSNYYLFEKNKRKLNLNYKNHKILKIYYNNNIFARFKLFNNKYLFNKNYNNFYFGKKIFFFNCNFSKKNYIINLFNKFNRKFFLFNNLKVKYEFFFSIFNKNKIKINKYIVKNIILKKKKLVWYNIKNYYNFYYLKVKKNLKIKLLNKKKLYLKNIYFKKIKRKKSTIYFLYFLIFKGIIDYNNNKFNKINYQKIKFNVCNFETKLNDIILNKNILLYNNIFLLNNYIYLILNNINLLLIKNLKYIFKFLLKKNKYFKDLFFFNLLNIIKNIKFLIFNIKNKKILKYLNLFYIKLNDIVFNFEKFNKINIKKYKKILKFFNFFLVFFYMFYIKSTKIRDFFFKCFNIFLFKASSKFLNLFDKIYLRNNNIFNKKNVNLLCSKKFILYNNKFYNENSDIVNEKNNNSLLYFYNFDDFLFILNSRILNNNLFFSLSTLKLYLNENSLNLFLFSKINIINSCNINNYFNNNRNFNLYFYTKSFFFDNYNYYYFNFIKLNLLKNIFKMKHNIYIIKYNFKLLIYFFKNNRINKIFYFIIYFCVFFFKKVKKYVKNLNNNLMLISSLKLIKFDKINNSNFFYLRLFKLNSFVIELRKNLKELKKKKNLLNEKLKYLNI